SQSHLIHRPKPPAGHRQLSRRGRAVVATVAAALILASCSVFSSQENTGDSQNLVSQTSTEATSLAIDSATSLSDLESFGKNTAQYFFPADAGKNDPSSTQLIVAGPAEADQYAAAEAAIEDGAPMLIVGKGAAGDEAKAQIAELAPEEIIQFGVDLNDDPALAETDRKISQPDKPAEGEQAAPAPSSLEELVG